MGSITRSCANNITTSGVLLPASLTNNSIANVTAYNASVATGNMVLISSQTASNSASISFTTGINSTYKEYQFWFVNIFGRTNSALFTFNMSTDSGSNYNVTKTTTCFYAYQDEAGTGAGLAYYGDGDLAQSTAYQAIALQNSNLADSNANGILQIFNPSSTTYVKHFISRFAHVYDTTPYSFDTSVAGYGNTTSTINAVRFQMSTGNFDGTILLYGIV